ncbi:MAG TPA: hypothetical protein PKJ63_15140 [Cyclobacteriaceae bacterium]|nr:hypothetical protein [Cyclobacteriaceae bacterium]
MQKLTNKVSDLFDLNSLYYRITESNPATPTDQKDPGLAWVFAFGILPSLLSEQRNKKDLE